MGLGGLFGAIQAVWRPILGPSRGLGGLFQGLAGGSEADLEPSMAYLGQSRGFGGPFWGHQGVSEAYFGALQGAYLRGSDTILGLYVGIPVPFWAYLRYSEVILGLF